MVTSSHAKAIALLLMILTASAQAPREEQNRPAPPPPRDRFMGPGGPGGPGFGGEEMKILVRFDKDADGKLNLAERTAAREFIQKERAEGRGQRQFRGRRSGGPGGPGRPGGPGGPGGARQTEPPKPGKKVSPSEVKSYPDAPLYAPDALRTLFLDFENPDWEKELADLHNTDVEVPAKLTVDGKTYQDVGIHFRGMSSYMGVPEGRKRSLNLSLDFVNKDQQLAGYRTLNLLNAHEDPSYLRPILFYDIARQYIPAPKANLVRVVINGEDWGTYQNVQQFNKDFVKDWFGSTKGARWKVRGSPGGEGSLAYLGDDPEPYRRIYTIKSKDDPKVWAAFIKMCKVLNETPPGQLEAALGPLLDIDGALKFLALDNALVNNDGYWVRTSDYSIYQDEKGKFHIIPQDANETFARPGGPAGPGGMRVFSPAMLLLARFFEDGDQNGDQNLTSAELRSLADLWFARLDSEGDGKLSGEQFAQELTKSLAPPDGFRGPRGGDGPVRTIAPTLFTASDQDKDGSLTSAELKANFSKWATDWDSDKNKSLDEEELRTGLTTLLPAPNFPGPGGEAGPQPRMRPMPGPGRDMPRVEGVKLDPLVAAGSENKPLISKLLAVPSLRTRYLAYVRDIAEKHLDWKKLGPAAERYHNLIAATVREETRKLDTTEAFEKSLTEDLEGRGNFGRIGISLKSFADPRREYLLNYKETAKSEATAR